MKNDVVPMRNDLVLDSDDYLITMFFSKNSSKYFSEVFNIAKGASFFSQTEIEKNTIFVCGFKNDLDDIYRFIATIERIWSWKNKNVWVKKRPIVDYNQFLNIIKCYASALECDDSISHCVQIIPDPYQRYSSTVMEIKILAPNEIGTQKEKVVVQEYMLPCRFLCTYGAKPFHPQHPSPITEQIQASAVKHNVDWCPFFDKSYAKKLEY